jgi:hypothetical protein
MQNKLRRGLLLAALTGSCVFAIAPAALAAPSTQSPEGIALDATGPVALGPIADATSATPNATAVGLDLPGIVNVGALTSTVAGNTTTSSVLTLGAPVLTSILGPITSGVITSTCTANQDGTFTKTTSVANLNILGNNVGTLASVPVNDTLVSLPAALVTVLGLTVTLNEQVAGPVAGSMTVNAIHIQFHLLGLATENIYIASSTCGPFSNNVATPVASGTGLGIGLGLLALLGAGFGAVYARRRHVLASA